MSLLDRRPTLYEEVRDWITARVADGSFEPGSRIVETRVARELGVSQGVVREALRELSARRLVDTIPNRGAFVRVPTQREVSEAHELRAVLEGYAARRAMDRGIPTTLVDELDLQVARMITAADSDDPREYEAATVEFHRAIVVAADHPLLAEVWESLLHASVTAFDAAGGTRDRSAAARSHGPIVDAIRSGDAAEAERRSRDHAHQFEIGDGHP